jgi:pyruvate dehydrogenase E2 component (dihydrolipoamide acetyltransferase)
MPELLMPRLSDSMEEATVVEWLKHPGDEVAVGDELALIETDKATVPLEATEAGTLLEVLVAAGETVALGAPLVRIGAAERRAKASPVARRIAGSHGVNLLAITGTGPAGRIVKADVRAALAGAVGSREGGAAEAGAEIRPAAAERPGVASLPEGDAVTAGRPLTRLQQTVARRMSDAKAVPEFVVRMQVDMEACAEVRARLKGRATVVPTYNDLVVKACALALKEHPLANGRYEDGAIVVNDRVNVGIAVAGEGTLLVPVIRDADTLPLAQIAAQAKSLAEKARANAIAPRDLEHATFTVSNLGMFGVKGFTAVLNPPQAAILAVGATTRQPVVHDDALTVRHATELTLTCDHRILYGADAARFLQRVRELLEEPLALML